MENAKNSKANLISILQPFLSNFQNKILERGAMALPASPPLRIAYALHYTTHYATLHYTTQHTLTFST